MIAKLKDSWVAKVEEVIKKELGGSDAGWCNLKVLDYNQYE